MADVEDHGMDEHECAEMPSMAVTFPGPFEHHDVVVEGRQVPFLRAMPLDGGQVDLTLDRRLGLVLTAGEAERFIPFVADAIAVALGYTAHPDTGRDDPIMRHPFPRVTPLFVEDSG